MLNSNRIKEHIEQQEQDDALLNHDSSSGIGVFGSRSGNEVENEDDIIPADLFSNVAFKNRIESLIEKHVQPLDE
jgi:hypothetical protein